MTTPLREALRLAAEDAPAYPVEERAVATGRRRRAVSAGLAVLALLGALGLIIPLARTPAPVRPAGAAAALPDRIGLPPYGSRRDTDRPGMAAATVLFAGSGSRFGGWIGEPNRYGLIGADGDYRTMSTGFHPEHGGTALLSPDGRSVAYSGGDRTVEILTLADLRLRHLDGNDPDMLTADPIAWSPDGRRLAVRTSTGEEDVLSVVDIAGGTWTRLSKAPRVVPFPTVAFAADGRLAFQRGNQVRVLSADGTVTSAFLLPAGSVLAGRGAWTPDGRALAVVPRSGSAWSLRLVEPGSGADVGGPALPGLRDLTVGEVLGWWPDGSALAFVHDARSARIVAVTPGAAAAKTVLTAPAQVNVVEVAAEALASGRTRAGDPPGPLGPGFWRGGTEIAAVVAVILVAVWLRRRAVRRRSRRVTWS